MVIILFVLAGLLFAVGVLIGSGLHTRAVDRRYRQVALLVRQLHEQEAVLARAGYSTPPYREFPRLML